MSWTIWVTLVAAVISFSSNSVNGDCTGVWSPNSQTCYIKATCDGTTGITVSIKGDDFPEQEPVSVAWAQANGTDRSYNSNCSITLNNINTESTMVFAPDNACIDDQTAAGTLNGEMKTTVFLRYKGSKIESGQDLKATITCLFSSSETNNINNSLTGTISISEITPGENKTIDWTGTTMTFVNKNDGSLVQTMQISATTTGNGVCVKVASTDVNIEDFTIDSLKFDKAATTTDPIDVIVSECFLGTGFRSLFNFPAMATNGVCTGNFAIEQCKKKRMVCFTPFMFAGSSSIYVSATLQKLDASRTGVLKTCTNANPFTNDGVGRKRRSADEDEDLIIQAELSIALKDLIGESVSQAAGCGAYGPETTQVYLITIFASAVVIFGLSTGIIYMVLTRKRELAAKPFMQ